jgi:hypothetical protein
MAKPTRVRYPAMPFKPTSEDVETTWNELIRVLEQRDFESDFKELDNTDMSDSVVYRVSTVNTAHTVNFSTNNVLVVDASASAVTITIPTAVGNKNQHFNVKKVDSSTNAVTLSCAVSIDTTVTQSLTVKDENLTIVSDGVQWRII